MYCTAVGDVGAAQKNGATRTFLLSVPATVYHGTHSMSTARWETLGLGSMVRYCPRVISIIRILLLLYVFSILTQLTYILPFRQIQVRPQNILTPPMNPDLVVDHASQSKDHAGCAGRQLQALLLIWLPSATTPPPRR